LSDQFGYKNQKEETRESAGNEGIELGAIPLEPSEGLYSQVIYTCKVIGTSKVIDTSSPTMLPESNWRSVVFRILFILTLVFMFVLGLGHSFVNPSTYTVSSLALYISYFALMIQIVVLFIWFIIIKPRATTTMIPCVSETWYSVCTIVWYAIILTAIVLAALEMRKTSCGVYTSYPISYGIDDKIRANS